MLTYVPVIDGESFPPIKLPGPPAPDDLVWSIKGFSEVEGVQTDLSDGTAFLLLNRLPQGSLIRPKVNITTPTFNSQRLSRGMKLFALKAILCDLEAGGLAYGIITEEQLTFRVGHHVKIKSGASHVVARICWVPADETQQPMVYVHLIQQAPTTPERSIPESPYLSPSAALEIFGSQNSWAQPRTPGAALSPIANIPNALQHTSGCPQLKVGTRYHTPTNLEQFDTTVTFITQLQRKIFKRLNQDLAIGDKRYKDLFSVVSLEQLMTLRTLLHSMFDVLDNTNSSIIPVVALSIPFLTMSSNEKIAHLLAKGIYYNAQSLSRGYAAAFKEMDSVEIAACRQRLSTMLRSLNIFMKLPKASEPLPRPMLQREMAQLVMTTDDTFDKENTYSQIPGAISHHPSGAFKPIN